MKIIKLIRTTIRRNSLIIKVITITFFIILLLAIIGTVLVFSLIPEVADQLRDLTQSTLNYDDIPSPYTETLFSYIFLNNIGHFWNPIRMLVWIPALGPLLLGMEIAINSGIIGIIAVMVGSNRGIAYPLIGLIPHGVIEIPAFLLQGVSIVLWQSSITRAIVEKIRGKEIERNKLTQGLKDALILAVISIIFLAIAAIIETYITPYLLGL